jgi:tetratricopeptide (TPR) repeat protein
MRAWCVITVAAALSGTMAPVGHASQPSAQLGVVDFPISCRPAVQGSFNRAVALLHHMTYPQARQAFEQVATMDPECAMAQWGIAMTLFQPLWPTRPNADALRRGWEAVQKAKSQQPASQREQMFIAAMEAFYLDGASTEYRQRLSRWEGAMRRLFEAFPDDPEAAAFYALAHLAISPSDSATSANARRAAEILARVYDRNPQHPGAMHYLVHANDGPGRERERLDVTRRYEAAAPRNPHALHMPTHIYTRLGEWDGVIRGNLLAAEAALEHPAGERGELVWDEFPHAIEYLVYAYLQKGSDAEAARQLERLRTTARLEPTFKTAFHLVSTLSRYALERHAWDEAAAIAPREPAALEWDRLAWPEAIARFARAFGALRTGRVGDAKLALPQLDVLEQSMRRAGEDLFARNIRMLGLELGAWVALAEGHPEQSVSLMRAAVDLEAATPKHAVTPAPTLPANELLGDLLMEQKEFASARTAYEQSLQQYPRRFNSLLGAARAARAAGDDSAARTYYRQLLDLARDSTREPAIGEARRFVDRQADR